MKVYLGWLGFWLALELALVWCLEEIVGTFTPERERESLLDSKFPSL